MPKSLLLFVTLCLFICSLVVATKVVYSASFGDLINSPDTQDKKESGTGFGGLLKEKTSQTSQQPKEVQPQEKQLQQQPSSGFGGMVDRAVSGSVTTNPSSQKTQPPVDPRQPEAFVALARPSLWQRGIDAVTDSLTWVWNKLPFHKKAVAYNADYYRYTEASGKITNVLNAKDIDRKNPEEVGDKMLEAVLEADAKTLNTYKKDTMGGITMTTNLHGGAIGLIKLTKTYKITVDPVADVDMVLSGKYLVLPGNNQGYLVTIGLKEGKGNVTYGKEEAGRNVELKELTDTSTSLAGEINTYFQHQSDASLGLIAVQLYKDINENGAKDFGEPEVPWAGVKINLR